MFAEFVNLAPFLQHLRGGRAKIADRRLCCLHLAESTAADCADGSVKLDRCFPVHGLCHGQDILFRRTCVPLSVCHLAPLASMPPACAK
jgi:hypothetical protein